MKKILSLIITLFVSAMSVMASPAYRKPFVVKQSDGTELTVLLTGDEALHYHVTVDGKPLVRESNGDYSYATFSDDGYFVSTRQLAHNAELRTSLERELLQSIDDVAMKSKISKAAGLRSAKYRNAAKRAGSQIRPEGEVNVAVLLVEFKDARFAHTKEDINNILNTEGYVYENVIANSIGSARDYFIAQSDGKFKPNFIVTDIVTLDNNMAYYGANDANGNDKKPSYMIKDGIRKADANFDFSICDNNGDGEVEFVYCIYAGYAESYGADENTVWPHQWEMAAECGTVTVDGVKCNTYACSSELNLNEDYEADYGKMLGGIGTMCHEFSHCLGLVDVYDVTYESGNFCMDYWDLMDQGSFMYEGYIPVGYSAYQRDLCGWRDLVVLTSKGHYSMEALTSGGEGYKVVNEANHDEYYILENRKKEGWDIGIFNEGMLVVHVDFLASAWQDNEVNVMAGHPRYTIIPADNELAVYGTVSDSKFKESMIADVWPGTTGNTELTNTSIPAAKVYTGGYMNKPITNIKYEGGVISFDFMDGIDVPAVKKATDVTETSFVANWEAVEGAVEYTVELYKVTEASAGDGNKEEILSEDFLGCSATNTALSYESIDDYMSSPGWECDNVYSENGVIRIGSSKNPGYLLTPWLEAYGNVTTKLKATLYNAKDTGVIFSVEYCDEEDNVIAYENYSVSGDGVEVSLSADVDGYFYLALHTYSSTGKNRVNIDNLVVYTESSVKNELVNSITTADTKCKFDGLDKNGEYLYRVKASDGEKTSGFSAFEYVQLSANTSVDDVVAEAEYVEVYTLDGVNVYSGSPAGVKELNMGVYLVKSGACVKKLFVR